jgi:hypothetical protein
MKVVAVVVVLAILGTLLLSVLAVVFGVPPG